MTEPPTGDPRARRIVAVVVTFNRLALLQRLVARLREVTEVDEILVVDNASTDGTGDWLVSTAEGPASTGADVTPVLARTLTHNRGGAGGFHDGLGWALERGADLAWLMDDDGIPAPDCLALLLERDGFDFWGPAVLAEQDPSRLCFPIRLPGGTSVVHRMAEVELAARDGLVADVVIPFNGVLVTRDDLDFWGPAVLAEQDPSRLCFPIRLPGGTSVVHRMAEVELAARDGLVEDVVIPFNGVLVTRDLVERIGLPREEFFIWGDDVEYLWRARRAGARVATVVDAHFLHPATDDLGTPMMFGRTTYNHSPSDLKHYCMARNNLLNLRDYHGWPHALAFVAKTLWFYALTRPSVARLRLSATAMGAGLRGDFTGHERFLR